MLSFPQETDRDSSDIKFDIVFSIIVLLAASFSAYTTYLGFSYDLPQLASIVIAAIIGLGLLIINFKIRDYRVKGQSVAAPLLAFLFFFIFSFISNTNAIYTYFLQKDIVKNTQVIAANDFDVGTSMILAEIDNNELTIEASRVKKNLDIAKRNLYNQVIDPANPGLGEKAKEHLFEVESILGITLTKLRAPGAGSSMAQYKKYAESLTELIDMQFNTKYITGKNENIEAFSQKINQLRKLYESTLINKEFSSDTTDLMRRDLDSLQIEARNKISFKGTVPVINTTADDIGSFNYTWTNFMDGINKSAIVLSVLLSIMLDTLAPVLALLLYRRKEVY